MEGAMKPMLQISEKLTFWLAKLSGQTKGEEEEGKAETEVREA